MENIWLWVAVGLILWQGMTLLQFLIFLYYKFRFPDYHLSAKSDIDEEVQKILLPYEKHLLANDFVFKYAVKHKSMIVGSDLTIYKLYYYNPTEGIHAFLETTPYRGSLQPVKLAYDTIYESKKICTTENGMEHFLPTVPKEIYFFDHYLPLWEDIFNAHLNDRRVDNEKIIKEPFDKEGWLAYLNYTEHLYADANVAYGVATKTEEGYRYRFSFALWKYAKKTLKGYRKFSKILKTNATLTTTENSTESQTQGLMAQMEQVDKQRGKGSSKIKWFVFSLLTFIALFSLFGFSIADVFVLVIVLLVHELGHFLAMRYFGYTDTNIFFLPFGAVTIGNKNRGSAYEEFIVSLMGPLPGIIIGVAILVMETQNGVELFNNSFMNSYAIMSIVINFANLLPIHPLDGGRIIQTLLLSRYPKGQFYFYIIGLAVLTGVMVWMRDPFLLIFVVLIALGLKNSYLLSEVLKKLFTVYTHEEITKESVASLLIQDEKFMKESLSTKAQVAKQALRIVEMKKPSRILIIFGMAFYLLLLSPTLIVGYFGLNIMHQSAYSNLSHEGKKELRTFNETVQSYWGLTQADNVDYTLEESMKMLDNYFSTSKVKRKIIDGVHKTVDTSSLPCTVSKEHLQVLQWHNGIEELIPYQKLFSLKDMIDTHLLVQREKESYGESRETNYVLAIGDEESYGLAYNCNESGLYAFYSYGYDSSNIKRYYNWNHFLKVTAEAYRVGAYIEQNGTLNIDEKKFAKLQREYYSIVDKERYEELIHYLQNRAKKYKDTKDDLLKIILLQSMVRTYDPRLEESVNFYLNDKNKKVQEQAIYTLGKIKK